MNKIDMKKFHFLETILWVGVVIVLVFTYFFLPRSVLSDAIKIIALIALFFCSCGYFVYRNLFQSQTEFVETILAENIKADDQTSIMKDLFENAKDGLVLLDNSYKIILISDSFAEELGYTSKELIGLSFDHIFKPEFEEKVTLAKSIINPPQDLLTCKIETKLSKKITFNLAINKLIKSPNSYSALIMIKKNKQTP